MSLTRMQQRRGTSLQWTNVGSSVVLAAGEFGFESDTGKFKIGDGVNYWNTLPYFQTETQNTAEYSKLVASQTLTGTQTLTPAATTAKALVVRGLASQTGNLQDWQNSTGTVLAYVDSAGNINFSGSGSFVQASTGRAAFVSNTATVVPLVAKGAVSQTAGLQQWQNSAGTVLAQVSAAGDIIASGIVTTTGLRDTAGTGAYIDMVSATGVTIRTRTATNPGLVVVGTASQTADLQQWQNSAGSAVAKINSLGDFTTPGFTATYGATINSGTTALPTLVVKGIASQTADLQQWQDSTGTVVARVGPTGDLVSGTMSTPGTLSVLGGNIVSAAAVASSLFSTTTTGNTSIASGLTTGTFSAGAIGSTGTVSLFPATGSQAITLGGATTGTVTLGSALATAVQLPTGKTKIGTSFLAQGAAFTYTLPAVSANSTILAAPAAISAGGVLYASTTANSASTAAGAQNQVIISNAGAAPTWQTLDLTYLPDAAYKKSVSAGTTIDLAPSLATSSTLTGYSTTSATATTTTAASATLTVAASAGIKVGAVVSTATLALAAGTVVATIPLGTIIIVSNRAAIATTAIVPTAGTALATFAAQTYSPYAVGSTITITGTTPATYSGSFVVTACTTTSVSWTTTETVTATVQGSIAFTIAAASAVSTTFTNTLSALTMDGITPVLNGRILVKNQTTVGSLTVTANRDNGIYYVSTLGTTTVPWVLTRVVDGGTTSQMAGATVNVDAGTTLGGQLWSNGLKTTDTLGTTAMVWNKLLNNGDVIPVVQGGTGGTTSTGTAGTAVVLSTSPTITTPTINGQKNASNTYTTTTTLTVANDLVFLTAAAAWTLTLPTPVAGKTIYLSRSDAAAFILSILGHINGVAATTNTTWFPATTANRRVILISDGTTWFPMSVGTVV